MPTSFGPLDMTIPGFAVPEDSLDRFAACYQYGRRHARPPRRSRGQPLARRSALSVGAAGSCRPPRTTCASADAPGRRRARRTPDHRAKDLELMTVNHLPGGPGSWRIFATGASASRNSNRRSGSVSGLPSDSPGRYRQCRFGGEYYWGGAGQHGVLDRPRRGPRRVVFMTSCCRRTPTRSARNSAPLVYQALRTDRFSSRALKSKSLPGESDLACV